jgi:hypothetical protein
VGKLRASYDRNIALFEAYALRNIFLVPDDLDVAEEEGDDAGEEEGDDAAVADLDLRIEALRKEVLGARKEQRTLKWVKRQYDRRLPHAEAAAHAIDEAVAGVDVAEVTEFAARAQRLEDLAARLSDHASRHGVRTSSFAAPPERRSSVGAVFGQVRRAFEADAADEHVPQPHVSVKDLEAAAAHLPPRKHK